MDGREHGGCGFPHFAFCCIAVQHFVAYFNHPKALVTSEYHYYQHSYKENGK
jgi:hypothetical protein